MAVERPLRDYGLQSERLLWPTKGPGVFEQGADRLPLHVATVEHAPILPRDRHRSLVALEPHPHELRARGDPELGEHVA